MTPAQAGDKVPAMKPRPSPAEPAPPDQKPSRSYVIAGRTVEAPALPPGLHIAATPIGNLGDITVRALEALAGADVIACEDTRVTRKLLDRYGIATPLIPYHEHNAAEARPKILRRLGWRGSGPGFRCRHAAHLRSWVQAGGAAREAGHGVTTLPGASATLAALTVAGLPTDRFFFEGFLPPKEVARRARIAELARVPATLVLFESGPRLGASLADLAEGLGPARSGGLPRTNQAA